MEFIRWGVALIILLPSLFIIGGNWWINYQSLFCKGKYSSPIPLVGGALGAICFLVVPIEGAWKLFWIPLLMDWGCIGIVVALIYMLIKRKW